MAWSWIRFIVSLDASWRDLAINCPAAPKPRATGITVARPAAAVEKRDNLFWRACTPLVRTFNVLLNGSSPLDNDCIPVSSARPMP